GVSLRDSDGSLFVSDVVSDSPAQRAGVRSGDRIVAFDGKPVASAAELIALVAGTHPADKLDLQVRREVSVGLDDGHKSSEGRLLLGVVLGDKREVGNEDGVAVQSVNEDWPAARAGIQGGDVIISVDGKHVATSQHVTN